MRYAIIGDIHGNLEACQAVINECQEQGARAFYNIGDIVGYGANPSECLAAVQDIRAISVAGNHDWAVAGRLNIEYFNPAAKKAIEWTQLKLKEDEIEFLYKLELIYKQQEFILVHGTLNKPDLFDYLTDLAKAGDTFFLMDRNICFLGHTHKPSILIKQENNLAYSKSLRVEIEDSKFYIVNVGSVGQPRDGNPDAAYCIYDPDLKRIEIKRIPYDVISAKRKILEAGLPEFLASRLTIGQ